MDDDIQSMMTFENFFIHCKKDGARLDSLEALKLHYRQTAENKRNSKMVCGDCGHTFITMRYLTDHVNKPGFKLRSE